MGVISSVRILWVGNKYLKFSKYHPHRHLIFKGETPMCSETCVCKWCCVCPKHNAEQHWLVFINNMQPQNMGIWSLKVKKKDGHHHDWKIKSQESCGKTEEKNLMVTLTFSLTNYFAPYLWSQLFSEGIHLLSSALYLTSCTTDPNTGFCIYWHSVSCMIYHKPMSSRQSNDKQTSYGR